MLCLAATHLAFFCLVLVAVIKNAVWQRPGGIRRGEASWGRFYLVHGLVLLLLFQLIGSAELVSDWNWRPLVSVFDFLVVSYLAFFNGWFRNWLVGLFNRLEERFE
jgi:hypothetical protein